MSTHTNENDPAMPVYHEGTHLGLTAREHAAIHLRVPMSGNPWLDAMITESRRWDAAQAAMQGELASISTEWAFEAAVGKAEQSGKPWGESLADACQQSANALTRQMKGGER